MNLNKALKELNLTEEETEVFEAILSPQSVSMITTTSSTNLIVDKTDNVASTNVDGYVRMPKLRVSITNPVDNVILMEYLFCKARLTTVGNQYFCDFVLTDCYGKVIKTNKHTYVGRKGRERAWRWCMRSLLTN